MIRDAGTWRAGACYSGIVFKFNILQVAMDTVSDHVTLIGG